MEIMIELTEAELERGSGAVRDRHLSSVYGVRHPGLIAAVSGTLAIATTASSASLFRVVPLRLQPEAHCVLLSAAARIIRAAGR